MLLAAVCAGRRVYCIRIVAQESIDELKPGSSQTRAAAQQRIAALKDKQWAGLLCPSRGSFKRGEFLRRAI